MLPIRPGAIPVLITTRADQISLDFPWGDFPASFFSSFTSCGLPWPSDKDFLKGRGRWR